MRELDAGVIREPGIASGVSCRGGVCIAAPCGFSTGGLSGGGCVSKSFVRYTLIPQQNEKAQPYFYDWAFKISVEDSTVRIEI